MLCNQPAAHLACAEFALLWVILRKYRGPEALHYENGLTVANGDYVLLHGRFSGPASANLKGSEHWRKPLQQLANARHESIHFGWSDRLVALLT
jgi:hypothetical protein